MAVKINIKTPCQENDDHELEAQPDWSVRTIKLEIEKQWANHPRPADQRLVYAGKLLEDEWVLSDILRQDEELNCHTMHLIVRQTSFPPISKGNKASELRQRKNANNSQSASATELYQNYLSTSTPENSNLQTNTASSTNPASNTTNLQPDQSNPWQMYLNSNQITNAQYLSQTPEQALMMQQMYAHYMAQYMQYVQSGGMWPSYNLHNATSEGNTPPAPIEQLEQRIQNPAGAAGLNPVAGAAAVAAVVGGHTTGAPAGGQNAANGGNFNNVGEQNAALPQGNPQAAPPVQAINGPGANPGNVVMNAGAGGMGAMEEEDEDGIGVGGQRDLLDWFYVASRVLVLFSIVYFYSSLARFALVAGLGLAVYLYRIGFFGQRIVGQVQNINANNNNNLNPNNNVEQNQQNDNGEQNPAVGENDGERNAAGNLDGLQNIINNDEANGNSTGDDGNNLPPASPAQLEPSWYQVGTTFLTTFFTSLMPNEQQVV